MVDGGDGRGGRGEGVGGEGASLLADCQAYGIQTRPSAVLAALFLAF